LALLAAADNRKHRTGRENATTVGKQCDISANDERARDEIRPAP
jgi:hypothetical protein